ncbi:hypothetical protein NL676_005297 [Syzygium grande]|nr:hypothetical protein NL676_005297 [Syzygium grande]
MEENHQWLFKPVFFLTLHLLTSRFFEARRQLATSGLTCPACSLSRNPASGPAEQVLVSLGGHRPFHLLVEGHLRSSGSRVSPSISAPAVPALPPTSRSGGICKALVHQLRFNSFCAGDLRLRHRWRRFLPPRES